MTDRWRHSSQPVYDFILDDVPNSHLIVGSCGSWNRKRLGKPKDRRGVSSGVMETLLP